MKKISTVVVKRSKNFRDRKLTIGLDLGDRSSWYCVLDEAGEVLLEQRLGTTPKAMKEVFGKMPQSRIALETGMHSPWVSRVLSELGHEVIVAHARNVRLIGESRRKDDRFDARTLGSISANRPAVAGPGATSQRPGASSSDGDPSASRTGAGADVADQHGAGTDEVLRGTAARLQSTQYECRESAESEPGTASGAGTVAGRHRIAERADLRIQPADREDRHGIVIRKWRG